jgi:hypothetical protein
MAGAVQRLVGRGFTRWRHGAGPYDGLAFVRERRPKPCAITLQGGNDTTDRSAEARILRDLARELWPETDAGGATGRASG